MGDLIASKPATRASIAIIGADGQPKTPYVVAAWDPAAHTRRERLGLWFARLRWYARYQHKLAIR